MRYTIVLAILGFSFVAAPTSALAAGECAGVSGDAVLSARTPEVDLYDGPSGKRIKTLVNGKFPKCLAVTQRAPNMMLQVKIDGTALWVPPHMVNYRLASKKPAICRNLAMGGDNTKVGATRALGEDCPQKKAKP